MGRDHLTVLWRAEILVSIHAPTWGATRADCWLSGLNRFQSTRPRGARRDALTSPTLVKSSFNPRAHVGRDLVYFLFVPLQRVSIHAPTWGATPARQQDLRGRAVSIHAPTWGATNKVTDTFVCSKFQSTRPRGARRTICAYGVRCTCFNPRAHVGRDPVFLRSTSLSLSFNPRAHVGRDSSVCGAALPSWSFNPRAHVGRDHLDVRLPFVRCRVSIHAPTWGATPEILGRGRHNVFQSTRPRGARLM